MKIDDLILKLQQIKEIAGNIEILIPCCTAHDHYNSLKSEDFKVEDGYSEGIDGWLLKIGWL